MKGFVNVYMVKRTGELRQSNRIYPDRQTAERVMKVILTNFSCVSHLCIAAAADDAINIPVWDRSMSTEQIAYDQYIIEMEREANGQPNAHPAAPA